MLKINRKTEYALLALEHMAHKEGAGEGVTSVREISESYHIPYAVLGKVMQKLSTKGFIKSIQGTKGGYVLVKRPTDISVADIVQVFDGRVAVADCFREAKVTCPQWDGCLIKNPFYELNQKILNLLARTTVSDLLNTSEETEGLAEEGVALPAADSGQTTKENHS